MWSRVWYSWRTRRTQTCQTSRITTYHQGIRFSKRTLPFNHIVGLPVKDKVEHPIYDYEKILYDALIIPGKHFLDKHLWVKKATGLGVTEFMLRLMAWLCTKDKNFGNYQMCTVTGPNIDIATKLIRRLKNIFE